MPAIRVFGRRWNLGSDDLVYPCALELIIRTTWLIAMVVVLALELDELESCQNSSKIKVFYIVTIAVMTAYFVLNVVIATTSAKGYIMDTYPRRHISIMLYIKLAVFVAEIGWAILGTMWIFSKDHTCRDLPVHLARSGVVVEWLIIIGMILFIYFMFDRLGTRNVKKRTLKDYKQMWHSRCRAICCCVVKDENRRDAFEEIAELLANFFQGRDYVLSDVLAGVVLLSLKQKYEAQSPVKFRLSDASTLPIREPNSDTHRVLPITRHTANNHQESESISGNSPKHRRQRSGKHKTTVQTDQGIPNAAFHMEDERIPLGQTITDQFARENINLFRLTTATPKTYGTSDPHRDSSTPASHPIPVMTQVTNSDISLTKQHSVASSSSCFSDDVFCNVFSSPTPPKDWMTLENAAYYLKIATAVYGSSNYSGCYNCSDRIPLCKKYSCTASSRFPSSVVVGDNQWECEIASIMLYAGFNRDQIIYANLENKIYFTPFVVARHDGLKAVVISIRGTMSAGDALTDLTAQGEDIREENIPRGNAHMGILKVARVIISQLEEEVKLKDKIPKGYGLVLTGHSLGAGVAAIIALLMRNKFPDVRCYAFCPPGGLVSDSLSVYMQGFVLTVFLGMDIVPRLSVLTMEKLKSDLLIVIKNSRVPKYKILSSGLSALCCGWRDNASAKFLIDDTQTKRLTQNMLDEISKEAREVADEQDESGRDQDRTTVQSTIQRSVSPQDTASTSSFEPESVFTDVVSESQSTDMLEQDLSDGGTSTGHPVHRSKSVPTKPTAGHVRVNKRTSESAKDEVGASAPANRDKGKKKKKHSERTNALAQFTSMLSDSHAKWRQRQKKKKSGLAATDPLQLPGHILYLYDDIELSTYGCCTSDPLYRARWARPEEFDHIVLDSKMTSHHNPYTVDEALQQILEQERFAPVSARSGVVRRQPKKDESLFAKPYMFDDIQEDALDTQGTPGSVRRGESVGQGPYISDVESVQHHSDALSESKSANHNADISRSESPKHQGPDSRSPTHGICVQNEEPVFSHQGSHISDVESVEHGSVVLPESKSVHHKADISPSESPKHQRLERRSSAHIICIQDEAPVLSYTVVDINEDIVESVLEEMNKILEPEVTFDDATPYSVQTKRNDTKENTNEGSENEVSDVLITDESKAMPCNSDYSDQVSENMEKLAVLLHNYDAPFSLDMSEISDLNTTEIGTKTVQEEEIIPTQRQHVVEAFPSQSDQPYTYETERCLNQTICAKDGESSICAEPTNASEDSTKSIGRLSPGDICNNHSQVTSDESVVDIECPRMDKNVSVSSEDMCHSVDLGLSNEEHFPLPSITVPAHQYISQDEDCVSTNDTEDGGFTNNQEYSENSESTDSDSSDNQESFTDLASERSLVGHSTFSGKSNSSINSSNEDDENCDSSFITAPDGQCSPTIPEVQSISYDLIQLESVVVVANEDASGVFTDITAGQQSTKPPDNSPLVAQSTILQTEPDPIQIHFQRQPLYSILEDDEVHSDQGNDVYAATHNQFISWWSRTIDSDDTYIDVGFDECTHSDEVHVPSSPSVGNTNSVEKYQTAEVLDHTLEDTAAIMDLQSPHLPHSDADDSSTELLNTNMSSLQSENAPPGIGDILHGFHESHVDTGDDLTDITSGPQIESHDCGKVSCDNDGASTNDIPVDVSENDEDQPESHNSDLNYDEQPLSSNVERFGTGDEPMDTRDLPSNSCNNTLDPGDFPGDTGNASCDTGDPLLGVDTESMNRAGTSHWTDLILFTSDEETTSSNPSQKADSTLSGRLTDTFYQQNVSDSNLDSSSSDENREI